MPTEIESLESQIEEMKKRLAELRRAQPAQPVENYVLTGPKGPVRLSELFGDKPDLLIIHNMGAGCSYCTLWADGFNGVVPELTSRAGLALVTPDSPSAAFPFAEKRGWRFPVVVDEEKAFSSHIGRWRDGGIWPGVSGFRKSEDGTISRIATADLGEGDDFCPVWHMLDLLKDGWGGWQPAYRL